MFYVHEVSDDGIVIIRYKFMGYTYLKFSMTARFLTRGPRSFGGLRQVPIRHRTYRHVCEPPGTNASVEAAWVYLHV